MRNLKKLLIIIMAFSFLKIIVDGFGVFTLETKHPMVVFVDLAILLVSLLIFGIVSKFKFIDWLGGKDEQNE